MRSSLLSFSALLGVAWAAPYWHNMKPRATGEFGCTAEPSDAIMQAAAEMVEQEENEDFRIAAGLNIDTYVHIVATSASPDDGYISDKMITDQIAVMNSNFAPHAISFTLVGTDRTINANWSLDGSELQMKRALRKGPYSALNLYFQKSLSGALGYCYFPDRVVPGSADFYYDGCTIQYNTVPGGNLTNYNEGKTATHEIGHWFGLFHTFQGNSCEGRGDMIKDTPQQLNATRGCPVGRDSCPTVAGLDPIRNYMDYSYDSCYEEFTAGQQKRMYKMFGKYRAGN